MSSISGVKSLILGNWKLLLVFILGIVAHASYQNWALTNQFSILEKIGFATGVPGAAKKPLPEARAAATSPAAVDLDELVPDAAELDTLDTLDS